MLGEDMTFYSSVGQVRPFYVRVDHVRAVQIR